MLRASRGLVVGMVVGAALLGRFGPVAAQTATTTTTTTTTSTTTTTVPPHPFSPATAACVKQAQKQLRSCKRGGGGASCRAPFETAFSNCFKAGAGVSCGKKCASKETTCLANAPTTQKTCNKNCAKTRTNDVKACRQIADGDNIWAGGDASCLGTADANFHICEFVCAQARADCGTNLKFCVANCPNQ